MEEQAEIELIFSRGWNSEEEGLKSEDDVFFEALDLEQLEGGVVLAEAEDGESVNSPAGLSGRPGTPDERVTPGSPLHTRVSRRCEFLCTQAAGPESDCGEEEEEDMENEGWGDSFIDDESGGGGLEYQHLRSVSGKEMPQRTLREARPAARVEEVYSQTPSTDDESYDSSFVTEGSGSSPGSPPPRKRRRIAIPMAPSDSSGSNSSQET